MLNAIEPKVTSKIGSIDSTKDGEIRKVAKQFEAMFTSIMLKTMNESVERSSLVKKSMGESIFQDMLTDEYANKMAEGKGIGLADVLYRSIAGDKNKSDAISGKIKDYNTNKYASKALQYTAGNFFSVKVSDLSNKTSITKEDLDKLIESTSNKYGVDSSLVRAVVKQESGGKNSAVSKVGAKGVMQLMDSTAKDMGVTNSFDPVQNVNGGVKYLRKMLDMFGGDSTLALAAYNAGPENVKKYNGVPPFAETQKYVKNIMANVSSKMVQK